MPSPARPILLLGVDCAMRNCGLALLRVSASGIELLDMHLVVTENESGKVVRRNSDDLRRARELLAAVRAWEARADVVAAEIPSGAQSARAALGFGMALGVLASVRKPLIQVQPTEVKKTVTGRKTATKEEMIAWASGEYPHAAWITRRLRGQDVMTAANEHLADAVAVGHTATWTDQWRGMLSLAA